MNRFLKVNVSVLFYVFLFLLIFSFELIGQTLNTQSFDNSTFPPTGWGLFSPTGAYWNRSTSGSNPTTTPHSGVGMAFYYSYSINNGNYCNLYSPTFDLSNIGSNTATVKFWMYRDNGYSSSSDKVEIYINTTTSTVGGTKLGTINRSITQSPIVATNGWYQYEYNLPSQYNGSANYLIFNAVSGYGNNMYIDDIEYTSYPSDMSFVSSTTEQVSETNYKVGTQNCKIIRLAINTTGELNKFNITSITFNTSSSTNPIDIANAKVYSTTSTTFTADEQFGSTLAAPSGEFTIIGSKQLAVGVNYFWLVYDVANNATPGNIIDAVCSSFVTSEVGNPSRIPTETNPEGNSVIKGVLTGTKTIANTGADYPNLYSAIQDLNSSGVGLGGVIFLINDGETINEPGLINITETGTIDKPIIIKQSGTGTKPILSFAGTSATGEACIKLTGCDYITIDGIVIKDETTSNNIEYGIYLLGSETDGCKNNTIKNSVIDLYKDYKFAKGVVTTSNATSSAGINFNNKFYNNTIQECYSGYEIVGNSYYPDEQNEIGTIDGGVSEIKNFNGNESYVFYGISLKYQKGFSVHDNKIYNFNGNGSYIYGIYFQYCPADTIKIYNNEITNLATTYYSQANIYAIYSSSENYAAVQIYDNEIFGFALTNQNFCGIDVSMGNTKISGNKIHDIEYTLNGNRSVQGIKVSSYGTHYLYNNMIYDLRAPHAEPYSAAYASVFGIYIGTPSEQNFKVNLYNNTVFFNYTSDNILNRSTALYLGSSSYYSNSKITLNNNIFVNNTNVTTGAMASAIWVSSTYINLGTLTNNNLYYAGTPSSKNLIYYDGIYSLQTIEAYRNHVSTRDQYSFTELPPFVNTTDNIDVHIKNDVPTQVEGSGTAITTPIIVNKDIDNENRNGSTPDLGADEGNFTYGNDSYPPVISYTNIGDGYVTNSKTVQGILITDKSGINVTEGTSPRLYYKKSTDNNEFNDNINITQGWKYVEGTGSKGTFEFVIDFTKLNSYPLVVGDVIQYFVIAQDLADTPNLTINTGTLNAVASSVNLASNNFPIGGTLKSFLIREGVQGEYLVGAGETYTTLTGTDGIFNKINNSVVTGNITIKITSDLTETGAIALNEFDNNFSVTIKPNSEGLKTITGAYAGGLIRFNGADNITIDGRYNDTGNNFTFFNNSSSYSSLAVLQFISKGVGQGSQNNTVRNCNIYTLSFSAGGTGIYVGDDSPTVDSSGADNDNYTIVENNIYRCRYGIAILGKSTGKNNNITIENNTLGYKQLKYYYIGKYGIYLKETDGVNINKNSIYNVIDYNNNMGKINALLLSTGVQNCNITKNNIYNVYAQTNDAQGASGIEINTGNPNSSITIINNSIGRIYCEKGISVPMSSTTSGISVLGTTGGIKIYNNSICVAGNNTSSTSVNISEGVYFASGVTGIELINNSIYNSTIFTKSVSKAYAIYSEAGASAFTEINYNNYYATGTQAVLGYLGSDKTTLEDWKTATGKDGNSICVDPLNLNDNNLQPVVGSPLINAGTPLELVTTDINNNERSLTAPAIGAYETTTAIPTIDNVYLITGNSAAVMGIATTYTAKIFEEGLTDNVGQGANVECWIGYSLVNTNPSTWNDSLWMVAGYNGSTDETNGQDEFVRSLSKTATNSTANLSPGTYYIAARFKIRHSGYKYAGYSASGGGEWDGSINVSPILTITDPAISWVNLESENPEEITLGTTHSFYGRVMIDGITNLNSNAGSRLKAWVGFNDANTNPSTWEESKWISGTVSGYQTTFHATQDQYEVETGSQLAVGTYYTATRFKLDNDDYVYGGTSTDGGGIWQQSVNENGVLQVVNGQIEWANLESPATLTKADGAVITILGHVKVPEITNDCNDESPYLKAWIGFSSTNTNPNTWIRWIPAYYYDCDYSGDAHIYAFEEVEPVGVGTFYYTFRYQYGNGEYKYGGYSAMGGGLWDGITNISGVLTVTGTIISDYPYFEGFEDSFPVSGWRSDDWGNWSLSDFTHSGLSGLGVWYDHTGSTYAQTPKFTLSTNMRAKFWWMDQDFDYTPDSRINNLNDTPLILGHDTTYFEITTNNGESWQTLCWLSKEDDETQFNKQIVNLSSYANQQVKFRWRDETDGSLSAYGMILDDFCLEKNADANNTGTILANNTQQHLFGATGVTLQFTVANNNNLGFDVDRIQSLPGGGLPDGILSIAPRYWVISIESGILSADATYTITLDLTGIGGIGDYAKIHLLKRNNADDEWLDLGVPNDITQQPILKWTGLTSFSEFGIGSTEAEAFPVELSSFTALVNNNKTTLNWTTATEINVNSFIVERCINNEEKKWDILGSVEAAGNSNSVKEYSFIDKNALGGTKFLYRLKVLDNDGSFNYSKELDVEIIPQRFELFQNYPNPFNPITKIKFSVPKVTKVHLSVYNAIGELVNVLIDENFGPGYFEYLFNASGYASGVYFYRLKTIETDIVKKMIILK